MKRVKHTKKESRNLAIGKTPTGIAGFDEITGGGIPQGRATLLVGGPGSGKTLFALQSLVHGASHAGEPGIFVAFEEESRQIIANAANFGWDLPQLEKRNLFFLDAQPTPDFIQSGSFDLLGMLAALEAKIRSMKAKRIVFDSVDVLLDLLGDPRLERRELYRLNAWLLRRGLTTLITSKSYAEKLGAPGHEPMGYVQFMVDCVVALNHEVCQGVSQRNVRVVKFRGSSFSENESPYVIAGGGLEVAGPRHLPHPQARVTDERVSTGVARLDSMLEGGYHRGASVLVTGSPGTAKSTLCGAFIEAACRRGEKAVFVSFDSEASELVRNLSSVGLDLGSYQKKNLLKIITARTGDASAEAHFFQIKREALALGARCLVVDPASALSKQGNELTSHSVIERLVDWCKQYGITLLCSSLLDSNSPDSEGTPMQISTIADTWMHLSYIIRGGERNRALTIVKSRGTAHSNQVRELILSGDGITLADVYTAGGEVLMGTMRWEKEEAERNKARQTKEEHRLRALELDQAEAELLSRLKAIEKELAGKRAARKALEVEENARKGRLSTHVKVIREKRRGELE